MYRTNSLERTCKSVVTQIEDELNRAGLFFRIFSRVKTNNSVNIKIKSKGVGYYNGQTKFLRDIIGIRVVLYFADDVTIVQKSITNFLELVEETIDINEADKFAPTRINLVFRLPQQNRKEFTEIVNNKLVDSTFEVQLRTILSEGWHEVEHDLRYKCKEDWNDSIDLSRNFNGILASLETSEYSTLRLFDQLSYRHYKSKDLVAMLRTKFRMRLTSYIISKQLKDYLDNNLIKEIFKIERNDFIHKIFESKLLTPITIEVLIYLINFWFIKNQKIIDMTPKEILIDLNH